ncbi:hypothetical protein E6C76_17395 [Pseudothauera nasutitermitis]|uniref:Uncharacterized protein n=1 Tax=Pseudothauera nasutitermitis TaxID=2565930 RepID=A0A4S4AUX9_9RHOO|nr:hypothetical protein [Pseudothauera nasutitermitis]THF63031.1 hypothetical protein E6C76_17395 [Pseudothauera nasutitermitis]
MNAAGRLFIDAHWDGRGVPRAGARIESPQIARELIGLPAGEALERLPALCAPDAQAQQLCAQAAIAAARGEPAAEEDARIAVERAISAEAAQQLLSRLLLDWPALFDHEPRRARFTDLHRRLARLAVVGDAANARDLGGQLLDLVAAELLSGFFTMAREPSSLGEFARRARRGGSIGAALSDLLEMGTHAPPQGMAALLPCMDAAIWAAELGGVPDMAFCDAPTWAGAPAETGALARQRDSALVRLLVDHGHPVAARLFAQVVDLSDWASRLRHPLADDLPAVVDAAPLGPHTGLARCESARGVLLHAVRLDGDTLADYAIITPDAWNFHPAGALALEGSGWREPDPESARRHLTALVLGLNPGLPFDIRFTDGDDA